MTNPDNVGGLPELPEPKFLTQLGNEAYSAEQMRAYGELCRAEALQRVSENAANMLAMPIEPGTLELCRAAPAGGDVSSTWEYGCDAPRNGGAPYIGATIGGHFVRFRIEDDFADAVKRHTFLRTLQSHLNAAPAGSGEASRMDAVYNFLMGIADLDGVSFGELHPDKRGRFWWRHELAAAYALLRKLQQGAE